MAKEFLTDVKTLRARARKHIEKGAVTEGYRADRDTVIRMLNEALATEIFGGEPNFGNDDPTSRRMLEGILAMEEEHAEDLATLLARLGEK